MQKYSLHHCIFKKYQNLLKLFCKGVIILLWYFGQISCGSYYWLYSQKMIIMKNFGHNYWKNICDSKLSEERKMQNGMNLMITNVINVYMKLIIWGRVRIFTFFLFSLVSFFQWLEKSHIMQLFTSFSTLVSWEALRCLRFDVELPRTTELPPRGVRIRQERPELWMERAGKYLWGHTSPMPSFYK